MKKFLIAAVAVLASLTVVSGPVSAQAPDPATMQESGTDIANAAACTPNNTVEQQTGQEFAHNAQNPTPVNCEGRNDAFTVPPSPDLTPGEVTKYLCGIRSSVYNGFEANGGKALTDAVDGVLGGTPLGPEIDKACAATPDGGGNGPGPSGPGGNGPGDDVLARNAAEDGGLPRTGGELFAGAGLGLMSLGAIARRFLR